MPLFEYSCTACGHRFEKLHRGHDAHMPVCPACSSHEVRRELSTFSSTSSTAAAACSSGGG